jgi:type I restriction enzyme M protein
LRSDFDYTILNLPGRPRGTERFRAFGHDELMAQGNASLASFWLRVESLEDTDNLPALEEIAAELATTSRQRFITSQPLLPR